MLDGFFDRTRDQLFTTSQKKCDFEMLIFVWETFNNSRMKCILNRFFILLFSGLGYALSISEGRACSTSRSIFLSRYSFNRFHCSMTIVSSSDNCAESSNHGPRTESEVW